VGADLRDDTGETESKDEFSVIAGTFGNGADNPLDANDHWAPLTEKAQRARSVEVEYHSSEWDVTFESIGGNRGRNFMFFGCEHGEH